MTAQLAAALGKVLQPRGQPKQRRFSVTIKNGRPPYEPTPQGAKLVPKLQGGFMPGPSGNPAESGKEYPDACERRKPGRPPHRPTAYWRGQVDAYASCGASHASIAKVIGIDEKTLRKHYAGELDVAAIKAGTARRTMGSAGSESSSARGGMTSPSPRWKSWLLV